MRSAINLTRITTISFDGDDTLWDFRSAMENALERTMRKLRTVVANDACHRLTVRKMIEIRDCVASELGGGRSDGTSLDEVRHKAFIRTLEYVGAPSEELAGELFRYYVDTRLAGTKPYPDVPAVLKNLKGRYRIGLISNGNSRAVLRRLPVTFDFVVFAEHCGYAKPDPRIFELALAVSQSGPEDFLHVGDSLSDDVFGANSSGLFSVWLNRQSASNETRIIADFEVRHLGEFLEILEGRPRGCP